MTDTVGAGQAPTTGGSAFSAKLDAATARLAEARPYAKGRHRAAVLELARRMLLDESTLVEVASRIEDLENAGIFMGTDWAQPDILQAALAGRTLKYADTQTAMLEVLNHLRMLAIAKRRYFHTGIASEHAHNFLSQVVGLNLDLVFANPDESARARPSDMDQVCRNLYRYVVQNIGHEEILDTLIAEIWRLLSQRPVVVDDIKAMIAQISVWLVDNAMENAGGWGADRLVSAVFGPTKLSREDPGLAAYEARIENLDMGGLAQEASAFARAMHDTGLVSAYHATFLRHISEAAPELLPDALGLSRTGTDALGCYSDLVRALIQYAVHPETTQAIYGLSLMLERGILYMPPVAPALWRQLALPLSASNSETIATGFGTTRSPGVYLTAGVLVLLGLPFGIGQGNNPTCQAARALSMWSFTDPDYLLQIISWAARDDEVVITFEGEPISSRPEGLVPARLLSDVDPVSAVVVPHLDRIYAQMGALCAGRDEDMHKWVNRELHGWWVGRGMEIAVDVATGNLKDFDGFIRRFYAAYHPDHNGGQPVIHPQPAGIAMTDGAARYVGWHAISICRVAVDQAGEMRVYFYNPNNDSGQDWGAGVVVATEGNGERFGESSLPIADFVSRLYLFHFDPLEQGHPDGVPADEIARVRDMATESWAMGRVA
ncbi:MAG: hypothetical protein JJ900_02315 [Rhodospirillales bacterium]|nr:hypothetical protein [Rhodospirillales bacterium]MBO6785657.1 hypothetical protein [Rhodospirillales bacterium]